MRTKFFFFSALCLCLIGLVIFFQPATQAAPLAICISTTGGGDWATVGTWQFCTGTNPPAATDDVYIQGPVTLAAPQTAANVTVSNGGSLNPAANTLTASSMMIDAGGLFTGALTLAGNLTDNGSFNGNGQTVIVNGTTSVGSGATFTAGSSTTLVGTLTNNGTFNCGGNTVNFQGNLTNNGTLNCGSGTVNFNGDFGQSVSSSTGAFAFNNFAISDPTGVMLNKNASVAGTLTFNSGDLATGANILDLSGATVAGAGGGDVVGNVKRTQVFATATDYAFNSPNTLINFTTLTSAPTDITINLAKSNPTGFARSLAREYNITANGAPVFAATLQLHYKSSEVLGTGITEANMRAWRFNTTLGKWELQAGNQTTNADNSNVQATGVAAFSKWALSDSGAPTAVKLSSFHANAPSFDLGAWLASWFNR